MTTVIDSARRCPRDGKRLAYDVGQHESEGDLRAVHYCLNCDYQEGHNQHVSPRQSVGRTLAERLRALRLGPEGPVELEIVYDDTPFPEMDLGESEVEAVRAS